MIVGGMVLAGKVEQHLHTHTHTHTHTQDGE